MILLNVFICQINAALTFSLSFASLIELLSALQIIHILLKTMAAFLTPQQFILRSLFQNIPFLTGGFEISGSYPLHPLVKGIWCLFAAYLVIFAIVNIVAFGQFFLKKKLPKGVAFVLAQIYTIHGRVLFFPIQFLFSSLLSLYNQTNDTRLFYNQSGWLTATIVLTILNHTFAIIKEFLLYQITMNQGNKLAAKNNFYHQVILAYKITILLMFFASQEDKTVIKLTSIVHFLTFTVLYWILRQKFPFYNFQVFKYILIFTAIYYNLAFISIIQVFSTGQKIHGCVDFMILLFPIFAVKILLSRFKWIFENILKGNFLNTEYAIHYGLLLEKILLQKNDLEFLPNDHLAEGAVSGKNEPRENEETSEEKEQRVYEHIIDKLEFYLTVNPKSELLMIYMAEIYICKLSNVPKFLELLRRLETRPISVHTKNKIDMFYTKIVDNQEGKDECVDLSTYFVLSQSAKFMKQEILHEIKEHIEFWTDIQGRVLDVKRTVDKALKIDRIHRALENQFKCNSENLRETFPQIFLLYGVYMNNVRYQASEGEKLFRRYELLAGPYGGNMNRFMMESASSAKTVVAILSLDKKQAGKIIDISGPLDETFHLTKTKLIGLNFGCLFPSAIAKTYQEQISDYAKLPTYKLDHKYKTYGKTADGHILEIEAHFQLYCYFNQEITVALLIKKKSEPQMICIASADGKIVDSSKDFKQRLFFEILHLPPPNMLQELSSQFEDANFAFNSIYTSNENMQQLSQALSQANIKEEPITRHSASKNSIKVSAEYLNYSRDIIPTGATTFRGDNLMETSRPLKDMPMPSLSLREKNSPDTGRLLTQTLQIEPVANERILGMCKEFMKGREISLNPRKQYRKGTVMAKVQIRPYLCGAEVYKIVILSDVKKDGQRMRSNSQEEEMDTSQSLSNETFADEFPVAAEKVLYVNPVIMVHKEEESFSLKEQFEQIEDKSFSFDQKTTPRYFIDENKTQKTENKVMLSENQSYREASNRDTKIMKALHKVSAANTLHPALKTSIGIVYTVIVSILCFVASNYVYSKHSIAKIEKGINIMSLEGQRISAITSVWYGALYLYIQGMNPSFLGGQLTWYFEQEMVRTLSQVLTVNNDLKDTLFSLGDDQLLRSAFEKDIVFWNSPDDTLTSLALDAFSSTDLLLNSYYEFTSVSSLSELLLKESIPYTFNNTANDYMFKSHKMSYEAEEFLHEIISDNIHTIVAILVSENVSLILFCFAMIGVAWVIKRVYDRLFKVLMRLHEEGVSEQLAQLKKVKALLDEDIDSKQFALAAMDVFEGTKQRSKAKKSDVTRASSRNSTRNTSQYIMKAMNFLLVKIVIGACLLVPVIAGIFAFSLNTSLKNFHGFERIKAQIFLLSEINYYSYLFISLYNYNLVFNSDSNFTFEGDKPVELLMNVINEFTSLNRDLLGSFLPSSQGTDEFTVTAVRDDACVLFDGTIQSACYDLKYGGLYEVGVQYSELAKAAATQYLANPTQSNGLDVLADYTMGVSTLSVASKYGYVGLSSHLLEILNQKTTAASEKRAEFLGIICTVMASYSLFLYFVPLRMFMKLDLARRRILNVIPYRIIQDNRMLGYYIVREFPSEIVGVNEIY